MWHFERVRAAVRVATGALGPRDDHPPLGGDPRDGTVLELATVDGVGATLRSGETDQEPGRAGVAWQRRSATPILEVAAGTGAGVE